MISHAEFTNPVPSGLGHYSVRESLDNEVFDKVIEVTLTTGQCGHIEIQRHQAMWRTSNGPFFTGSTRYVSQAGTFLTREEAIEELVKFLKTQPVSI
jgi:hypothetical protein